MNTAVSEVLPRSDAPLSVKDLRGRIQTIQQVMKGVMKKDHHYGVIPGTQKPSLWKAGAEVLLATFRIGAIPEVTDLSGPDEVRYRVSCIAINQVTGEKVGAGIGECSSNEDKYRWRSAKCEEEFDEATDEERRLKWVAPSGRKPYQLRQVRVPPADVANTILKMAKKRAMIDMTLSTLGCSDIFEQDVDDRDERDDKGGGKPDGQGSGAPADPTPTERKADASGKCTKAQQTLIKGLLDSTGVPDSELYRRFNVAGLDEIPFTQVDAVLSWLRNLNK